MIKILMGDILMDNRPFHHWMPEWAQTALKNRVCSNCSTGYSKNDIIAIGFREMEDGSNVLYIEHQCSSCSFRAITTLGKQGQSLESLCYNVLESIKHKKLQTQSKNMEHPGYPEGIDQPWTDKEVKSFLSFVKKSASHEDFLREIGVTLPPEPK